MTLKEFYKAFGKPARAKSKSIWKKGFSQKAMNELKRSLKAR